MEATKEFLDKKNRKLRSDTFCMLVNIWRLDWKYSDFLDGTFYCTMKTKDLNSIIVDENFPASYRDGLYFNGRFHFISYIFCSRKFISGMTTTEPDKELLMTFRRNEVNSFYHCLIRSSNNLDLVARFKERGGKLITPQELDASGYTDNLIS